MKYNIEGLAEELEVELESIVGLYTSYIEEMKEEILEMTTYLEKTDWTMLERVIHNIKGVSANLCIMDVFSEAEKFDLLLKKNITLDCDKHITKLINLIRDSEVEIKSFFNERGLEV